MSLKDKLHIIIILSLVLVIILILMLVARMLRPDTFDEFGHYRWSALDDIKSQKVITQSTKTCMECHKDIYQLHEKDAHYNVPCVDCHGAGDIHVSFHKKDKDSKGLTVEQAKLPKEYKLEGCLFCHRQLKARPTDFPQVNQKSHYNFLHIKDTAKCIACHNPHEPIFLLTEVRKSRLHPIVYKCTDCHDSKPKKDFKEIESHPKIFECRDCHSQIVSSFEKRPHNEYVECRTCHLFHKENGSVGRMYKNGNAKFCLLCHQKESFKDPKYPPKIEVKKHLGKFGFLDSLSPKVCLNCHWNQIHEMNIKNNISPHPENWRKQHRPVLMKNYSQEIVNTKCGSCHKNEFCSSCHGLQMPHSDSFKGGEHKNIVMKKGMKLCYNCHVEETCTFCHDMPVLSKRRFNTRQSLSKLFYRGE